MRTRIAFIGLLAVAIGGGACIPLIDLNATQGQPPPATTLGASVTRPTADRTVPSGAVVAIEWTAGNTTGNEAIGTLLVRRRADRAETILSGGVRITATGVRESFTWDTTGFDGGAYNIIVRITAGALTDESIGTGIITINSPPDLTFTDPFEDATLPDPDADNETPTVRIRWSAFDADGDGKMELSVDPDSDPENGNEILLLERDLASDASFDSFEWNGDDMDGERVETGTYRIFARIFDDVNPSRVVNGLATITIPDAVEPVTNKVTEPSEDRQFLASETSTKIQYTIAESDDVLIDLKIDTDDNHQNGNEVTILAQRLVEADTDSGDFDWNGQDSAGVVVGDNIYRVFMVINRGSGPPTTLEAAGLIFRRSEENKPLIGLLQPATDQTVNLGQFVTIRWRDDDPSETARITLRVDDDAMPQESTETGAAEIEILTGREAKGDGVQDSFAWQVPSNLAPGTYFIFAYIDRDGAAPFEHASVAPGRIIIRDPAMP